MSEARTVFRHSAVYALGQVLNRGAAFALVPIYTWFLGAEDYGLLGVVSIASEVIGAIIGLRLAAAMARIYFNYPDARGRAEVVSTALLGFLAWQGRQAGGSGAGGAFIVMS